MTAPRLRLAPTDVTYVRLRGVLAMVPISRSTLYRWVREGRFPKPVVLSDMIVAWRIDEVRAWLERRERGDHR